MTADLAGVLEKTQLFKGLSKSELEKVVRISKTMDAKKGDYILKESDTGDSVYVILSGRLDVSVSLVGQQKIENIATLNTGDIVGESILLGKSLRSAFVLAKDDVRLVSIRIKELIALFDVDHHIGYVVMANIARNLVEKLDSTNHSLRNLLTSTQGNAF